MKKKVFGLIGAGGMGREVMPYTLKSIANTLRVQEASVELVFVETGSPASCSVNGYPLISLETFLGLDADRYFNVAIGDGRVRKSIVDEVAGEAIPLAISAPDVLVLDGNEIGVGAVMCPRSMITSNAKIGDYFQCNYYSHVAHDCVIGDFVTFAPGVRCNGRVRIDDFAYIGSNVVIREGTPERPLRIGREAVVGMGAVVTKDVPDGATVTGNPARLFVK